ncbi:MAG: glutamate--tRNA ligase [Cytophagales bacterium]|nr:glutamate--tRNA ligase [Cytophagales bacterium]
MEKNVRVRFAPSPTGGLHIGGVRTALYNYLFAKKMGGEMILRIEDTDQTRFVEGAEEYIVEALEWIGIEIDESPANEGQYGPYRQSERKPMYMQYAQQLIDAGHAYYAFDTPEELEEMRERLKAARVPSPQYNAITRMQMKNSLTLPADEVKAKLEAGEPYVIRLKVPRKEEVRINDMVRSWVVVHSSAIDDKVLVKADGMPTYHLANVVDDHLMKITHVIRGEEWLPSAPLHVLLYKYLGWEDTMPQFAHLPLILKPTGNGKLSKRDADKLGFPIFPLDWTNQDGEFSKGYREAGYLPEALTNFLAFLGWSPGNNEEMFDLEALIEAFSVERIGKAGTKFDIDKAKWYNQQYLKEKTNAQLAEFLLPVLQEKNIECSQEKAEAICEMLKERIVFYPELWENGKYFFFEPEEYDAKVIRKKWSATAVDVLGAYAETIKTVEDYNSVSAKEILVNVLEEKGVKMGVVMQSLRVAATGEGMGPDLMSVLATLGAQEVARRIEIAIEKLADQVKD